MKICRWCGVRLYGWRRLFSRWCRRCNEALALNMPSPPYRRWARFEGRRNL